MKRSRSPSPDPSSRDGDEEDEVPYEVIRDHNDGISNDKDAIQAMISVALRYKRRDILDVLHEFVTSEPRLPGNDRIYDAEDAEFIGLDDDLGSWVMQNAHNKDSFGTHWILDNGITGEDYDYAALSAVREDMRVQGDYNE